MGADPSEQLREPERLRHVVVGARIEAEHHVDLVAASGDDDDGGRRSPRSDAPAEVDAVGVGEAEVHQREVGALAVGRDVRGGRGRDPCDAVALGGQRVLQAAPDGLVVLHDQDVRCGHGSSVDMTPRFAVR